MTELEIIEHAKTYLDKMANGIDPITDRPAAETDMINNVRISRCLFFVSDVLRRVIENGGVGGNKNKKAQKPPFALTAEQQARFVPSENPVTVSQLANRITELAENDDIAPLRNTMITDWLQEFGLLQQVINSDGQKKRLPTEKGASMGISAFDRVGVNGSYVSVVYDAKAQQFIIDNIDAVTQLYNSKHSHEMAGQPWTQEHDECLADLYRKNVPIGEIAVTLKRSRGAIKARLIKLGLEQANNLL